MSATTLLVEVPRILVKLEGAALSPHTFLAVAGKVRAVSRSDWRSSVPTARTFPKGYLVPSYSMPHRAGVAKDHVLALDLSLLWLACPAPSS